MGCALFGSHARNAMNSGTLAEIVSIPAREYETRYTHLNRLWSEVVGVPKFSAIRTANDDRPIGSASLASAYALSVIEGNRILTSLARQFVDAVVIHCDYVATGPAIELHDQSLHFYKSAINWSLHARPMVYEVLARAVFKSLSAEQRAAFRFPAGPEGDASQDFSTLFSAIVANDAAWLEMLLHRDGARSVMQCTELLCEYLQQLTGISLLTHSEVLRKQLLPERTRPSLEMPPGDQSARAAPVASDWSAAKNSRRCDLIDKEIAGTISQDERLELDILQTEAVAHRDRVAPLPIEGARALHKELLKKKRTLKKAN
jgi:hypothetical protein